MKTKVKRTIYFTNHKKMLKHIERFASKHHITVSSAILGFVGIGLIYQGIEGIWREEDK